MIIAVRKENKMYKDATKTIRKNKAKLYLEYFCKNFLSILPLFIIITRKKYIKVSITIIMWMKSEKIANKVWKLYGGKGLSSNIYLVDVAGPTLIDLGSYENTVDMIKVLEEIGYESNSIVNIVFTHLHPDHTGQPSRFENAKFFASKEEINAFNSSPSGATIIKRPVEELKKIKLEHIGKEFAGMEVIKTPGHTVGSICLWLPEEKILFSGDTLFDKGFYGRVDLETSVPEKMSDSLKRLKMLKYKILCPEH